MGCCAVAWGFDAGGFDAGGWLLALSALVALSVFTEVLAGGAVLALAVAVAGFLSVVAWADAELVDFTGSVLADVGCVVVGLVPVAFASLGFASAFVGSDRGGAAVWDDDDFDAVDAAAVVASLAVVLAVLFAAAAVPVAFEAAAFGAAVRLVVFEAGFAIFVVA